MHSRTSALLDELNSTHWFSCVGQQETDDVIILSSWPEALHHCNSLQWENVCLEAANHCREQLLNASKALFNQWNDMVIALKPIVIPFVQTKLAPIMRQHSLPPAFKATVEWDILHICVTAEYGERGRSSFYDQQAYWYKNGHFPCGWEGPFPQGTLVVF